MNYLLAPRRLTRSVFACCSLVAFASLTGAQASPSPTGLPEELSVSDWNSIRDAYESRRYEAYPIAGHRREFGADNPGQRFVSRFDSTGFTTTSDNGDWSWGLELLRYGFAGFEKTVGLPLGVAADGSRITYHWDTSLKEWYVNGTHGLEHGFTLEQRAPLAGGGAASGPLTMTLRVRGELRPEIQSDGLGVSFSKLGEDPVLSYAGLLVHDAVGRRLPASFRPAPEGLLLRIDEFGARYPVTIDPLVQSARFQAASVSSTQEAYLKPFNTGFMDSFGNAVAISGDTVVVGVPLEDSRSSGVNSNGNINGKPDSGAAYVFVRNGTTWSQEAYLKASNSGATDLFGGTVDISGDTIVVGAQRESSSARGVNGPQNNEDALGSGAAYVFVRNGTSWSQQAYLKASNAEAFDFLGLVAICGDTIVAGAPGEPSNAAGVNGNQANNDSPGAGAAYVFVRTGTSWSQQAYLKASNPDPFDSFGIPVDISGDTIVVGSSSEASSTRTINGDAADNSAPGAGAAFVFVRNGGVWSQEAYLKAPNADAGDAFGGSVSIEGNTVIVGAAFEDGNSQGVNGNLNDNSFPGAGAAYVYRRLAAGWVHEAYLKASNPAGADRFGSSVAVSGDLVVVGAGGEDGPSTGVNGSQGNGARNSGAAYLFSFDGGGWSQESYLKAPTPRRSIVSAARLRFAARRS